MSGPFIDCEDADLKIADMLEDKRVVNVDGLADLVIHGVHIGLVHRHALLCQGWGIVDRNVVEFRVILPVFIWNRGHAELQWAIVEDEAESLNCWSLPRMSSSSWARPKANTGMRQRPSRFTMSWTVLQKRASLSSLFSWMCVPYVDSYMNRKEDGHKTL